MSGPIRDLDQISVGRTSGSDFRRRSAQHGADRRGVNGYYGRRDRMKDVYVTAGGRWDPYHASS